MFFVISDIDVHKIWAWKPMVNFILGEANEFLIGAAVKIVSWDSLENNLTNNLIMVIFTVEEKVL